MSSKYVKEITPENYTEEIIYEKTPVLLDLWADWCGPCKMLSPVLDKVAESLHGIVNICKLNITSEWGQEKAKELGIKSIPALIFMRNGEEKDRHLGAKITAEQITERLLAIADSEVQVEDFNLQGENPESTNQPA
jgi:thioredoxin 1